MEAFLNNVSKEKRLKRKNQEIAQHFIKKQRGKCQTKQQKELNWLPLRSGNQECGEGQGWSFFIKPCSAVLDYKLWT